jgi:hypothetical protein
LASNQEIEERYLVSRVFSSLSLDEIKQDFRKYAGVGNAVHKSKVKNREGYICVFTKKILNNINCDDQINSNPYDLVGDKYFDELMNKYVYVKNNYQKYLEKYRVDFVVVNNTDNWTLPSSYNLVWKDAAGSIFMVH